MKITFIRSGGFAGIRPPPLEIDTASLSAGAADAWTERVASCGFFNQPSRLVGGAARDAFVYTITVEDGSRTHTVRADESAAGPINRLIAALETAQAGDEGPL